MDNRAVITSQPYSQFSGGDSSNWGQNPSFTAGYSGFEYLRNVDQLYVTSKKDFKPDGCCDGVTTTTTTISNTYGQPIYTGIEEKELSSRNCQGLGRSLDVKIKDGSDNEIGQFLRDTSCAANCCICCIQRLEVYAPLGNLIAIVSQNLTFLCPNFSILTPEGKKIFDVKAAPCLGGCSTTISLQIYRAGEQMKIGQITKYWKGRKELPVEGECYHITFPSLLEIDQKVALLGSLYLIDLLYQNNDFED